jgi:hypothetical protein
MQQAVACELLAASSKTEHSIPGIIHRFKREPNNIDFPLFVNYSPRQTEP